MKNRFSLCSPEPTLNIFLCSKGRCSENEKSIFLFFNPPQKLVHRGYNCQLGLERGENCIELKGLGEPAEHDLVGSGEVEQLQRPGHRMKSVLEGQVDSAQPFPFLLCLVAHSKLRGGELSRCARFVQEMAHFGKLNGLGAVSGVGDGSLDCCD